MRPPNLLAAIKRFNNVLKLYQVYHFIDLTNFANEMCEVQLRRINVRYLV
ncbi:MAG: hypothetical protein ACTS6A_02110 [Candidatus Hodgkinia cicadicola]